PHSPRAAPPKPLIRRSERSKRIPGDPYDSPVLQHSSAHLFIEPDRVRVPIEDCPLKAPALAFNGQPRQCAQHPRAETTPANHRLDIQVFKIKPALAEEGR